MALKYKTLNQTHPDYDLGLYTRLSLLKRGGWDMVANAKLFVPKAPREPDKDYQWRLSVTSYVNHLSQVVGYLAGALFNLPLEVTPAMGKGSERPQPSDPDFYAHFAKDCDLKQTPFSQFMREVLADALVFRRVVVQVDMPPAVPATTRLEEEQQGGARAYLCKLDLDTMINWECLDDTREIQAYGLPPKTRLGLFKWCVLKRKVPEPRDPFSAQGKYRYEFKVWMLTPNGAQYQIFRTKPVSKDEELHDEDDLEEAGGVGLTSFRTIPIRELILPEELWAGNAAGPLCMEHFRMRSDLNGSMLRSLVEIPFIKRGSEIPAVHGAIPSMTQQDPNRGADPVGTARDKGFVALGADDELGFAGPSGKAFEIALKVLDTVKEDIYRSVHAMALSMANSAAALSRSGDSKREDRSATGTMLDYMGDVVRGFAVLLYSLVSSGRGDADEWEAAGLDTFDDEDRETLVTEASDVNMLNIPSPTFQREFNKRVAIGLLPKAEPATKEKIKVELEKNITDESVLQSIELRTQAALHGGALPEDEEVAEGEEGKPPEPKKPEAA